MINIRWFSWFPVFLAKVIYLCELRATGYPKQIDRYKKRVIKEYEIPCKFNFFVVFFFNFVQLHADCKLQVKTVNSANQTLKCVNVIFITDLCSFALIFNKEPFGNIGE